MMRRTDKEPMKILVPIPLHGNYKIPLMQASFFHNKYGAEVIVLNVYHKISRLERWLLPGRWKRYQEMAYKKLKNLVQDQFRDDAVLEHMKFEVVTGDVVSSILKVAGEKRADLIIIKKAKRLTRSRRFLKQENADRLIANSVSPVLTIHNKPTSEGINKILLPVDITKKTDNKVAWAKSIAKRFGAEIHIVSAMNMKLDRVHSLSYQKGRRIEEEIRKEGINTELVLLEKGDKPVEDLVLGYADEYRPDLLLIMTHQENNLFDNYLGSFAREIIHQAKMPVFSVIPRKENVITGIIDSVKYISLLGRNPEQTTDDQGNKEEQNQ